MKRIIAKAKNFVVVGYLSVRKFYAHRLWAMHNFLSTSKEQKWFIPGMTALMHQIMMWKKFSQNYWSENLAMELETNTLCKPTPTLKISDVQNLLVRFKKLIMEYRFQLKLSQKPYWFESETCFP